MTNSNGIDINEPNSAGMTAVSRAVQRELDEVVNVLFEYGATFFGPQSRGDVCYLIAGNRFDLLRQALKPYIDAGLRVPSSHLCTWDMVSVFHAVQGEPLAAYEAILQDDIMQALGIDAAYINASFAVRPHPLLKYMHQSPTIDILKLLVLKGYDLSGPVMQTGKTASDTVLYAGNGLKPQMICPRIPLTGKYLFSSANTPFEIGRHSLAASLKRSLI
jgi:hypothetical protein